MPVKLSTLAAERDELKIPVGSETLTVGFRPQLITGAYLQEEGELTLPQALARLVSDWDLEDDETPADADTPGPPLVPITEVSIAALGVPFQRRLYNAIRERALPNLSRSTT